MRRPLIALAVALAALTACSSDDNGGEDAAPTTVTTPDATSTTASSGASIPADCPSQPDSGEGSPAPTQGSSLTDGFYFGYITFLDAEDLSLRFDAAQLLTGDAAARAAAEDGGEASDFWIRNSSKATRMLELAEDATLCTADPGNVVENRKVSLPQLNQTLADGEPYAVWLDVRSGTVERVQHQYFP